MLEASAFNAIEDSSTALIGSSRPMQHLYSPPRPQKHPSNPLRSLSDVQPIGSTSNRSRVPLSEEAKHLLSIVVQEVNLPKELNGVAIMA